MIRQISASELNQRLQRGDEFVVLDVREPGEIQLAALPGTTNIPMNQVPARAAELPRDKDLVVLCHHGMRSMNVAGYLSRLGFENLYNLAGGIDAWSRDVDPKVPLY
jgi:rhodanese-related sulfurtransferase